VSLLATEESPEAHSQAISEENQGYKLRAEKAVEAIKLGYLHDRLQQRVKAGTELLDRWRAADAQSEDRGTNGEIFMLNAQGWITNTYELLHEFDPKLAEEFGEPRLLQRAEDQKQAIVVFIQYRHRLMLISNKANRRRRALDTQVGAIE
jgi:hypothetical protein